MAVQCFAVRRLYRNPPIFALVTPPPSLQPLTPAQRDVAVQCFVLRLLSDFTLMYQHCVGVLLKRDTDIATKEVGVRWHCFASHRGSGANIRHPDPAPRPCRW